MKNDYNKQSIYLPDRRTDGCFLTLAAGAGSAAAGGFAAGTVADGLALYFSNAASAVAVSLNSTSSFAGKSE